MWRGPRKTASDPIYASKQHRANRKYWAAIKAPCAKCGYPIDYTADGRVSLWALHIDHIVPVAVARERGWTVEMISALSNSRPLHRKCNIRAGARLGQQRQRVKAKRRKLVTSRVW